MKEANQLPDEVTGLIEQFLRDMGVITAQCSGSFIGCSQHPGWRWYARAPGTRW